MTTGVERGPHLDREGIRTDRAKWNLPWRRSTKKP